MKENKVKNSYRKDLYTESARKDRFHRVVERRTNKVLEALRLIGNTGNRTLYLYEEEEVDKIFKAIEEKLIEVKGKLRARKVTEKFKL